MYFTFRGVRFESCQGKPTSFPFAVRTSKHMDNKPFQTGGNFMNHLQQLFIILGIAYLAHLYKFFLISRRTEIIFVNSFVLSHKGTERVLCAV